MMSARKEEADKVEGLQGADDYLAKPFSLAELKARVASHLRRWQRYKKIEVTEHVATFTFGLAIDWHKELATLENKELALTQKEFALLKLLAKNPGTNYFQRKSYISIFGNKRV